MLKSSYEKQCYLIPQWCDKFEINSGKCQDDHLSIILLVFLNGPNKIDYSFEIFNNLISNLFSMGDLKLFARYYNELKDIVAIINKFSDDIAIKF